MSRKILIANTNSAHRVNLRMILQKSHYTVSFPDTLKELLAHLKENMADVILFSEGFAGLSSKEFCATVAAHSPEKFMGAIPVILLTSTQDITTRLDALWDGMNDIIPYPCEENFLLSYIRNYFRQRESEYEMKSREIFDVDFELAPEEKMPRPTQKIGCFSNGTPEAETLIGELKTHMPQSLYPRSQSDMSQMSAGGRGMGDDICLIFVDRENPAQDLSLIPELRSHQKTRFASIVLILPQELLSIATLAFDLSANAVIFSPTTAEEIALRLFFQLERKNEADIFRAKREKYLGLALRDPLTQLYNLRYLEHYKRHLQGQIEKHGRGFSVFVIDLDHFKEVNDSLGHIAGDDVLKGLAFRLNNNLRPSDIAARIGGEEFLVIMNAENLRTATRAAKRILTSISAQPFLLRSGEKIKVTASIGVAFNSKNIESVEETIKRADEALYLAKKTGRNKIHSRTKKRNTPKKNKSQT